MAKAVDLAPFPKKDEAAAAKKSEQPHALPPAWHGSILPAGDADIWLAAAFADYEKIVALEKSLAHQAKDGKLSADAQDRLAVARFAPESRWLAAARRAGQDLPLAEMRSQWDAEAWYAIAAGKGTMLLATLRTHLGAEVFDKALDVFGRAHAGQAVSTQQFREHLEQAAGHSLAAILDPWLSGNGTLEQADASNFWAIDSFEIEPERALIVYGTLADRDAQREAAELLQRKMARRFTNFSIPITADKDVSDDDLRNHHVLLIGRPATNSVAARLAAGLSIRFGEGSFVVRDQTYAHADTTIVAAGSNRLNPRYSIVVYAGLGARATRACIESLADRGGGDPAEILLTPAGQPAKPLRITAAPLATAMP